MCVNRMLPALSMRNELGIPLTPNGAGNDVLHGAHQLAQKSTSTTLPLKVDNSTVLPSALRSVTFGANVGDAAATHPDASVASATTTTNDVNRRMWMDAPIG